MYKDRKRSMSGIPSRSSHCHSASWSMLLKASTRGEIPAILFIIYIAYACCTIQWPHIWEHSVINVEESCDFWQHQAEYSFAPGKLVMVTSIVWVSIIHWLACSEITAVWLEYTLRGLNILDWFSKGFHVVFAYCTSYACSIHVQPRLDALVASNTKDDSTNQNEKQCTTTV
jgi:hypothetical protein